MRADGSHARVRINSGIGLPVRATLRLGVREQVPELFLDYFLVRINRGMCGGKLISDLGEAFSSIIQNLGAPLGDRSKPNFPNF